jgi:hypothetical protein
MNECICRISKKSRLIKPECVYEEFFFCKYKHKDTMKSPYKVCLREKNSVLYLNLKTRKILKWDYIEFTQKIIIPLLIPNICLTLTKNEKVNYT